MRTYSILFELMRSAGLQRCLVLESQRYASHAILLTPREHLLGLRNSSEVDYLDLVRDGFLWKAEPGSKRREEYQVVHARLDPSSMRLPYHRSLCCSSPTPFPMCLLFDVLQSCIPVPALVYRNMTILATSLVCRIFAVDLCRIAV
jgi:hypothetical protein